MAFAEPLIHMFNKSAASAGGLPPRPHVLLVGDSDGDASMADGLAGAREVLKVGIINDAAAAHRLLPVYGALFDVVLVGDPPAWPLMRLLARLEESMASMAHRDAEIARQGGRHAALHAAIAARGERIAEARARDHARSLGRRPLAPAELALGRAAELPRGGRCRRGCPGRRHRCPAS